MTDYNATRYDLQSRTNLARWSSSDSDPKMTRGPIRNQETEAGRYRRQCHPSGAAARLVRPPSPAAAVAAAGRRTRRSLFGLAVGNHAAADRRQNGRTLFRKIPGALAGCHRTGPRLARRGAADVGRARLLF